MFRELQPLLDNRSFVLIVSAKSDGQLQCSFIPKAIKADTEQDKPLLQPLTLTGTAAELDEGIAEAVTDYSEAYKSMAEQVAATKKAMADAKAADEAKRKADEDAKKNKGKKPSPAKAAEPKPAPAQDVAPSLFDQPVTPPSTTDDSQDDTDEEDDDTEEEEVFEP